ncbi:TP53-binding protein 1 isoform X8 [Nelusetta ayraudi]|uniref:TP53-binding protein 1 isoform X8 n=1 Tax=Nelusetta ayraudi TaxID=303726 RepID=UPI003F70A1F8
MDPPGSDLDSSLPHSDNPCLIVEDSQPDSVALEDDPESGYRAVLARRLSSLQPPARSPVLELVSSPIGSKNSQTDSQSEFCQGNNQEESDVLMATDPSAVPQEESQVLNVCPPPVKKCSLEDTDAESGADSTTHCVHPDGGTSQFSLMELSQSQDLCSEATNSHRGDNGFIASLPEEGATKSVLEQQCRPVESQDNVKASRSEVSSSSSSESSARQLTVQVLLHSEGLQSSQQDDQMLLSQEDLFDGDKSASTVDSTVSEPEQPVVPTPARSLHLLHLSGQGTLVQQSLSQSSVDYVAPSQEDVPDTPLIVPSSPTAAESQRGPDKPMDTSLSPEDQVVKREESADPKPLPSASTPASQNSPGFALDEMLSVPSQPDFSHDVFGLTQSQEATKQAEKKNKLSAQETLSQRGFTMDMSPMQLSVNTQNSAALGPNSQHCADDSQATQIDEGEEEEEEDPPAGEDQRSNSVPSDSQTPHTHKSEAPKHCGIRTGSEPSAPSLKATLNAENVNVKGSGSSATPSSLPRSGSSDLTSNSCVEETPLSSAPCSSASQSMICQAPAPMTKTGGDRRTVSDTVEEEMEEGEGLQEEEKSQEEEKKSQEEGEKSQEVEEKSQEVEEESTGGGGSSGLALVLSQSQLLSLEPVEEGGEDGDVDSVVMLAHSEVGSQLPQKDVRRRVKTNNSQPIAGPQAVAANGHKSQVEEKMDTSDGSSQSKRVVPEPEGLKDKSLSDSSGDISFHFTLPKDGELIGPAAGATPPLFPQLKRTLRHSTPIEISSFSEKSDGVAEVPAASSVTAADGADGVEGKGDADGKLSLRMKLVTPVEEVNSDHFSLQKPTLSPEGGAGVQDAAVAVPSSPSVFSRVREVHQQQQEDATAVREESFASSPLQSSQASSLGCCSLPNSQLDALQQEALSEQQQQQRPLEVPKVLDGPGAAGAPEPVTPNRKDARTRVSVPSSKLQQRSISQQTSFELPPPPPPHSPAGRGERESPSSKRTAGPSHRRHVRTVQEVRTTVTRIITDVYYEDGKEVERKVSQESEEPVVDCQVLDSDISPCRTGNSSMTSGDLADVSSLSSKASSLQHSSGGTSSSGASHRPHFVMPPSRGAASLSPRRGGGHQQRGHRGQRAGLAGPTDRGHAHPGSQALTPLSPRGRARRGRPPSRSFLSRGSALAAQRLGALDQPPSSSEDEPFGRTPPPLPLPRLPSSPSDGELPAHSDSLRSTEDDGCSPGSSFVGLRVVAKWSSNGYFYSGRIVGDAGEQRFRLRFDDGYECEVAGKDILLCDPIPLETEVTALLEDDFFSVGVVKDHKAEGQELSYSVQRDGQCQWYKRTAIILSLEQGNKLREQHSLGPYQPCTPLAKASDISLDNLVEGKRRRRVATETAPSRGSTPNRSPAPGPSGKRKLMSSEEEDGGGGGGGSSSTPAKRGRRGPRAAQRLALCNTSGSGADLPAQPGLVADTHGPLPHNASLFMGFAFMLTVSCGSDRLTNRLSSDEDEEYVQTGPYNRAYTESQLEAGGGFVLPDFNEEQCKAAYQSLLIADQHCRTMKYLLCLASGVPCVSHLWVRDCCKENKLLNYRNYLLPAGVAPDQAIVEWHARRSPFKALRLLLALEEQAELLAQLTTLGGASSVQHYRTDGDDGAELPAAGRYDVVVTDGACPPPLQRWAASQDVPLVSAEWLVQSVIRGERQGFAGEPQYRHDHAS